MADLVAFRIVDILVDNPLAETRLGVLSVDFWAVLENFVVISIVAIMFGDGILGTVGFEGLASFTGFVNDVFVLDNGPEFAVVWVILVGLSFIFATDSVVELTASGFLTNIVERNLVNVAAVPFVVDIYCDVLLDKGRVL